MNEINKEELNRKTSALEVMFKEVETLLETVQKKDGFRLSAREKLLGSKDPRIHMKGLRLGNIIREELQRSGGDSRKFIANLKLRSTEIAVYDRELAEFIQNVKIDDRELNFLNDLSEYLEHHGEHQLKLYLTNQGPNIVTSSKGFNELHIAKIVEELWYLIRYLGEVLTWGPELIRKKGRHYFTQRLLFFIRGNEGLDIRGILTYFKDSKLMKAIRKSKILKRLLTYSKLRSLFAQLLIKARKGIQEKNWADFEEFWENRKRYERLVKELGYEEFFASLKKEVKEIKQDPLAWIKQFQYDLKILDNPDYINERVISPAVRELIVIFEDRVKELIAELKESVADKVEELKGIPEGFSRQIVKKVTSREKRTRRSLGRTKRKFKKREEQIVSLISIFLSHVHQLQAIFNFLSGLGHTEEWGRYSLEISSWSMKLTGEMTDRDLPHPSILAMLMSSLTAMRNAVDKQDQFVDGAATNIVGINVSNLRKNIMESHARLDKMQDDLIEFLRNLGIDKGNDIGTVLH